MSEIVKTLYMVYYRDGKLSVKIRVHVTASRGRAGGHYYGLILFILLRLFYFTSLLYGWKKFYGSNWLKSRNESNFSFNLIILDFIFIYTRHKLKAGSRRRLRFFEGDEGEH